MKNAIEACENIDEINDRKILLEMKSYNEQLFLTIRNRAKGEVLKENNHLISTKADTNHHGIGSRNVFSAVQKYDGDVQYLFQNGWFIADISL